MQILKVLSVIYNSLILLWIISQDCKVKDRSTSIGMKVLEIFNAGTVIYLILN